MTITLWKGIWNLKYVNICHFLIVQIIFCTPPSGTIHLQNCGLIMETISPQTAVKCLEERVPLSNLHKVALSATGKGD